MILLSSGILGLAIYGLIEDKVNLLENESLEVSDFSVGSQSSTMLTTSIPQKEINMNPAYYLQLAESNLNQGDTEEAIKILEEGVTVTGSEELKKQAESIKLTAQISDKQLLLLNSLYNAFISEDNEKIKAAVQQWTIASVSSITDTEALWIEFNAFLAWDGTRFQPNYTGVGIAFDGNGIYYGEMQDGIPNGKGNYIANALGSVPIVQQLWLDGIWNMGIVVENCIYHYENTYNESFDANCVFDGSEQEIIISAEIVYRYIDTQQIQHEATVFVRDGRLSSEGIIEDNLHSWWTGSRNRVFPCSLHSDCSAELRLNYFEEEDPNILCQNPQPWNKKGKWAIADEVRTPNTYPYPPILNFFWNS